MGHDIRAYAGTITPDDLRIVPYPHERGEEIAYLRGAHGIYAALDAADYDGKVSGIGIGRWFTRQQLQIAEQRLINQQIEWQRQGWSCESAIVFIRTCLERMPADRAVCYIDFG